MKDYVLCPAIPWIRRKLGWREPDTEGMKLARSFKVNVERWIKDPVWEVWLRDRDTHLSGVVDVLGSGAVGEIKAYFRRTAYHFRIQLLAYSYLADRNGFRVRNALLFMGDSVRYNLEVRREHLDHVEKVVKRVADVLEDDSPPTVNPGEMLCKACQYRRVCPVSVV